MNALLPFLLARLKEPSSYAGLATLAAAAGLNLAGSQLDAITTVLVALAGLAAVFVPEKAT